MFTNIQAFIGALEKEKDLVRIGAEVDPHLEAAEIHRRVISEEGPAILFEKIKGSPFPLVTNLFGTRKRIEIAFGSKPENFIKEVASLPHTILPPSFGKIWNKRRLFLDLMKVGTSGMRRAPVAEVIETPPNLSALPLLTTWKEDGGPFITLPLVYTEHPELKIPNLGMYRMQRYDASTTGLHCQIGKGGGFHLAEAKRRGEKLPVSVFIGGPPALILSAISPLPENVPEILLASLVMGKKLSVSKRGSFPHPFVSDAEFVLQGSVDPNEMRPEGPFGDHYGYYSLRHDYPVFRCHTVLRKRRPILTATVVGKPKQEDFYLGDYLQELLSPLFPVVMPAVVDLWSYGETGYHSLAAAVVKQRYKREAMASAFRILGEGQLSLTKFLLVIDKERNLKDFRSVLEHILERCDLRTDLYVFSNLSMDTLDYTGPVVNEGSKGVLLGVGDPIRRLTSDIPSLEGTGAREAKALCRGCLVLEGPSFKDDQKWGERVAKSVTGYPLVVLVDNAESATKTAQDFLWTTFTRFEPGADITASKKEIVRNHIAYEAPIVIDSRMKPNYPDELLCDPKTEALVSRRWKEYFPSRS